MEQSVTNGRANTSLVLSMYMDWPWLDLLYGVIFTQYRYFNVYNEVC